VCAGQSIPHLYKFLKTQAQIAEVYDKTPAIVAAAMEALHPDPLSVEAVNMFVSLMGSEAGNLALTVLATGGVYIAGGMAQRTLPGRVELQQRFLSGFHDKGRLTPLLAHVPIHLITEPVALAGAAFTAMEDIGQRLA
jgi:glucokinase